MMIMIDDDDRKDVWCWWWSWIIDDDVVGENDNDHDDKRKVWAAQWCVLGAATLLSGPSHAPLLMTISMMAMAMMVVIRNYDDDHSDENYHAGDSEKTLTYPQPPLLMTPSPMHHRHQCYHLKYFSQPLVPPWIPLVSHHSECHCLCGFSSYFNLIRSYFCSLLSLFLCVALKIWWFRENICRVPSFGFLPGKLKLPIHALRKYGRGFGKIFIFVWKQISKLF